ncbi:alpha/beta fold hydrolase [Paenibacillus thermoaerophilus]|uniref:Alpha/beta fold hydrolase n=1 Tax=Paenibacillus thermoaerophilus TaxID=1215385 RepID=A0ABW2V1V8_9BACL|nr:alpha/beta hydrolase [Paenibacillus thermoaerophilus]TMV13898.1 alpha/beta hydrolase [Paenibacillus thermoaerophilus]
MGYYIQAEQGVHLFVEDVGSGVPVLFIHGWPLNHLMWEYQVTQLPKYGYRCIQVDLRGYGKSDRPWSGYGYDRMADDIRAVVDALGLTNARLVGFSMGGAIAIRYMSRHNGHGMSRLILAAAAAPSFTMQPDYPYGMSREAVDSLIAGLYANRPQTLDDFGNLFFASNITESFRSWFNALGLSSDARATIAGAEALRDEDLRPDLPRIQTPTYIFHGVMDRVCLFPLALEMHKGIRGSTLVPFQHSGHGLFYDELELFNRSLLTALKE